PLFLKVSAVIDVLNFFFCSHEWHWVKQFQWFEVSQVRAAIFFMDNKKIFDDLLKHRQEIEKEFGDSLEWQRLENKSVSIIRKIYTSANLNDPYNWDKLQNEMIDGMVNFHKALKKYINNIKD
ncbi:MAG: DUF4268 domain-containing protein, partial [Actinobacteria bacterium]|nr:DUF4268 domain-containing protein [Actinomycetota bacterium]